MATSNAAALPIPKEAVEQLESLLRHIDRVPEIIEKSSHSEYGITLYQILSPLSEEFDLPYQDMMNISQILENIKILVKDFGSFDETISRIIDGIDTIVSAQIRNNMAKIRNAYEIYLKFDKISISMKAQRLVYYYEHILRDTEVLTDMRPIFDTEGKNVLEIAIMHTLVVTHTSSGRTMRLHLAMDAADVVNLRRACERAELKANTLKEALNKPDLNWKVHLLRDEDAAY